MTKAGCVAISDTDAATFTDGGKQQDRLAGFAGDGSFALNLNGGDLLIVDLTGVGIGEAEKHVLAMYWLWNDVSQDRSGIQLVRFRVQRLGVQVIPALP